MYSYLVKEFSDCIVVDICDRYFTDGRNKWSLAPMHYCKEYYINAAEIIYKQVLKRQSLLL